MPTDTLDPVDIAIAELDALIEQASRQLSSSALPETFPAFLEHCKIESDDPLSPGPIPFVLWDAQRERAEAWDTGRSEVVLKRRQVGASWLVAAYKLYVAAYHVSSHVGYWSKGQDEARHQLAQRVKYIWQHLPSSLRVDAEWSADLVRFAGASSIRVFPSTDDAGISYTFRLAVFDEFAKHAFGARNLAAVLPSVAAGGQLLVLSTAHPDLGQSGAFYDLWQDCVAGKRPIKTAFIGRDARPDQDAAWMAVEASNYGTEAEFTAYYPRNPDEAFVSHSGLVYGADTDGVLIFSPENIQPAKWRWEDSDWRIGGLDPGGRDPTGMRATGVQRGMFVPKMHGFAEFCTPPKTAMGAGAIAEWFMPIHQKAPFDVIVCDPSAAALIETLATDYHLPVIAANNERATGVAELSWWLKSRLYTFSPGQRSEQTVKQYGTYWYADRKDSSTSNVSFETKTPSWHHAEMPDVDRYIAMHMRDGSAWRGVNRRPVELEIA